MSQKASNSFLSKAACSDDSVRTHTVRTQLMLQKRLEVVSNSNQRWLIRIEVTQQEEEEEEE